MMRWIVLALSLSQAGSPQVDRPHPQLTYGAIQPLSPECAQGWAKDASGALVFKSCSNRAGLFEALGRLDENDPLYETKKAILIELIDTSGMPDGSHTNEHPPD